MMIKAKITKMDCGLLQVFLDKKIGGKHPIKAGVFTVEPGKSLEFHTHEGCDEYCWVFKGVGNFEIGGKDYVVKQGEVIKIPKDIIHRSYPIGKKSFTSFFIVCS